MEGIDIVVQSTHKCLGALSQTSLCHLNEGSATSEQHWASTILVTTTTSPSSIFFASIEEAILNHASDEGKVALNRKVEEARDVRKRLSELDGVTIFGRNEGLLMQDPLKIAFKIRGKSGLEVFQHLRAHNYDPEYYNCASVLISCHIGTTKEDLDGIVQVIGDLAS